MLPAISLGCWHNFGAPGTDAVGHGDEAALHENARRMLFTAFDHGITHLDLANNYGPPPGSAEARVGRILREDLAAYRDELIISTKAGYEMWPGPYGNFGSRKYLLASLDASLKRLGLEYVDIFYHHRPDPGTPLDETMGALDQAVRSGKALYAGISNYRGAGTMDAVRTCEARGLARPIIHQPSYSMLNRWIEGDLLPVTGQLGLGVIVFSPLAQGLLSDKYLDRVPDDSRAKQKGGFLKEDRITPQLQARLRQLADHARQRGQSLAQMALAWSLRDTRVTTALIGASRPEQIIQNCQAMQQAGFSDDELKRIEGILAG
jgi:L-glyceraldehyde 3-phosphate reductase